MSRQRPHWIFVVQVFLLSATLSATSALALQISPNGSCGGNTGFTCVGSKWGDCCSGHGFCGNIDAYCAHGCDLSGGTCNPGQGTTGVPLAPRPTDGADNASSCRLCPACPICMSPSPTPVPSSCRRLVTATSWETATTTKTVFKAANGTTMESKTVTVTATVTQARTQTLVRTQTRTVFWNGTANATSPKRATTMPPLTAAALPAAP
ncbi:uncharacterized protein SPSK_07999 [Sporothrix schenckii 1099-18]|uniref:Chitin-binding type-1 domain-containing protein n=1 Tax=Sporothrix schenckii 1099-18 TaxID=1397361 RepID=A0A0F2MJ02_SPOSC|nr:uncharacterized protein SPSK_07999 [Sporothrix schenckii 1099-18]KJR88151.1 hypothetical protein SPSK_07999 [Sporothrix schenckii 1099-18]